MTEWLVETVKLISLLFHDLHNEALFLACSRGRFCGWSRLICGILGEGG